MEINTIIRNFKLKMPPAKFKYLLGKSSLKYGRMEEARLAVFEDTVSIVCKGSYINSFGRTVPFLHLKDMCIGSVMYENECPSIESEVIYNTIIRVVNSDCLDEAQSLMSEGYNPVILNLANGELPCAGSVNSKTQEESIFRRTTLFLSLYQFYESCRTLSSSFAKADYKINIRGERYPMKTRFGAIYSPSVTVFRMSDSSGYDFLDTPFEIGIISSAAIINPARKIDHPEEMLDHAADITRDKIRTILRIGLLNGHDSIVLGAYGCGAFNNPPKHMARLFKEVIEDTEFEGKYKLISFAILDDSFASVHENGNFRPFVDTFKQI